MHIRRQYQYTYTLPIHHKYWCRCYQCSFTYKSLSQFFKILIISQDIWWIVYYVSEINLISQGTLIRAFYLPNKTNQKKPETGCCTRKTAAENNAKSNFPPNIPGSFLLFKATAFLQIFFLRNVLFRQVLRTSIFINCKILTFLFLFISLVKNIH